MQVMSGLVAELEDEAIAKLRDRAVRRGVPQEQEALDILREALGPNQDELAREPSSGGREPTEAEIERRKQLIMSYGVEDAEPFDLKAFSDALSDGPE
jgi:antitoxin FitA